MFDVVFHHFVKHLLMSDSSLSLCLFSSCNCLRCLVVFSFLNIFRFGYCYHTNCATFEKDIKRRRRRSKTHIGTITMLILGECICSMALGSEAASSPSRKVIDNHNIKVVEMKLENVHIYIHWTHISNPNTVFRVELLLLFSSLSLFCHCSCSYLLHETSLNWFERYVRYHEMPYSQFLLLSQVFLSAVFSQCVRLCVCLLQTRFKTVIIYLPFVQCETTTLFNTSFHSRRASVVDTLHILPPYTYSFMLMDSFHPLHTHTHTCIVCILHT